MRGPAKPTAPYASGCITKAGASQSSRAGPVHCDSTQSAEATASMVAHSARAGQTANLRCNRLPNHRRMHRRSAPQPQRAPLPARRTYVTIANTSVLRSATHADHGVPHAFHCDESVFTVTARDSRVHSRSARDRSPKSCRRRCNAHLRGSRSSCSDLTNQYDVRCRLVARLSSGGRCLSVLRSQGPAPSQSANVRAVSKPKAQERRTGRDDGDIQRHHIGRSESLPMRSAYPTDFRATGKAHWTRLKQDGVV